jgi:hypothetical protein
MEATEHTKLTAEIIALQQTIIELRSELLIQKIKTEAQKDLKDFYKRLLNDWQGMTETWKQLYFNSKKQN